MYSLLQVLKEMIFADPEGASRNIKEVDIKRDPREEAFLKALDKLIEEKKKK